MATDVIIDPSTGQIYWNDSAGVGTESISIKGDAVNIISFTGYSGSFSPGSTPAGALTLVTIKDSAGTDALIPGTSGYNLGSSTLRWNTFATNANLSGTLVVSDSTGTTSLLTGSARFNGGIAISGGASIGQTLFLFNGANYTAFVSSATGNTTYTLPPTSPATGTSVLQSTSAGVMSWGPMTTATTVASGSVGTVQLSGSSNSFAGSTNFQYNVSSNQLLLYNFPLGETTNQYAALQLLGYNQFSFTGSDGGTFFAINAATGFTGDLIHALFNGVSRLQLNAAGYLRLGVAGTGFTLPITNGTSGQVLTANTNGIASWTTVSGGGTPGGSNKQIQFNNSSAFGGASGFEYTTGGIAVTVAIFSPSGTGYTSGLWISAIGGTTRVGIGLSNPQYELEILGEISATNKSFVINHPTKSGMKLRYGSLEGPENGVYVRGELNNSNIIEVPDHWLGLVHEDSYTVHLTPIGRYAQLYVEKIENYNVYVADNNMNQIHCYYNVWAERKDIPKLITEY
jgi:hypothetical protein